jgi:outer membrane autotransporter protein
LNFTADAIVITTGYDLGTTNINGVADGALIIDKNQTITGDITKFGTLGINGNHIVNINTANFAADIKTKTGGEGTVNFNNAGVAVISIGHAGTKISALNFSAAKTVGAVYANNISILANGNATFNGVIDANQIKFTTAVTSTANFGARPLTTRLVSDGGTGKGIANFAGTGIQADVGAVGVRLAQANFAVGQVSAINANIYADAINVNGAITMNSAATFDGASTFAGATIALGGNDLTFNNGAVAFNGKSVISTTITRVDLGNLVAGAGSNIILNGELDVQVNALAAVPVDGQKVTLIQKNGGTLNLNINNIKVTKNGGAFAHWRQEIAPDGSLILTNSSQIAEDLNDAAEASNLRDVVTPEVTQAVEGFVAGTQGEEIVNVLNTFLKPDGSTDKFALADGVARLANTTANEVVGATFETVSTMTDQINARMFDVGSFASPFAPAPDVSNVGQSQGATTFTPAGNQPASGAATTSSPAAGGGSSGGSGSTNVDAPAAKAKSTKVSANELSGIAAGDQSDRYGIWATPFYSKSTQKKRGSSAGYKSDGYGGTFGFDTRANEEMIVGLAVTAMNSDIKHKDFKSGDKTKVGTILFSAYSNYQFGNNWFGQGVFSIGSSNVTNKEKRRISTTSYSIASDEYSSMTFASEVLGGYNHLVNNQLVLTPMFGVGYSRINDSSYQETGNGPQLLSVTKRASQKVELVGGLRVTGLPFIVGEVSLTPEMHGSVRHDVIGKGARVDAKIPGLPKLPSEKAKLQKTYYNLGASLKASYGMMDYGVAADTMFAKKYVGVNGSVNVRVNF